MLSLTIISFSNNIIFVVAGMTTLGIGHGMIYPTSAGLIKDKVETDALGLATGLFYGLLVAGIAVGAPISGIIADTLGYTYSLYSGVILSAITIITVAIPREEIKT